MWQKQRAARQKGQGQGSEACVVDLNNNLTEIIKSVESTEGECLCQHKYVSSSCPR